ncbi:MAG: hypothetical protein V1827_02375 [Candidatus Micrarchaeota archaeon]
MKNGLMIFGALLLIAGFVFAIAGAGVTAGTQTRWTGASSGNVITEGGNITPVNVTADTLTDRWAGFWGEVSGALVLGNSSLNIFKWTISTAPAGEVCVSTNNAFPFTTADGATGANIDTAWGFGLVADNGSATFTGSNCAITLNEQSVTNAAYANHTDSLYNTCALDDGAFGNTTSELAYCAVINSAGTNYLGGAADYELMVPTNNTVDATTQYYFYLELN